MPGPLNGIRIIEIAGIGPGPFAGMMLADSGAEIIRVDRPNAPPGLNPPNLDILSRSRKSIALDLKKPEGAAILQDLAKSADGIIEGFRPGVMERLGLGPEILLAGNPKLVYGRMTGWGQTGPLAKTAGHDIDYIALAGALHAFGRAGEKPTPPINMIGDFGGGGMMLAFGMVSALLNAARTGVGQVIDCAMVDGAAGAHFYDTYETADGKYMAVGAIEPQFYAQLRELAGLTDPAFDSQMNFSEWPDLKYKLTQIFKTKTRDEWTAIFYGTDACVSPILSLNEAPHDRHNAERGTFIEINGITQPAPAPRYSATPSATPVMSSANTGADTENVLTALGYDPSRLTALREAKIIA